MNALQKWADVWRLLGVLSIVLWVVALLTLPGLGGLTVFIGGLLAITAIFTFAAMLTGLAEVVGYFERVNKQGRKK